MDSVKAYDCQYGRNKKRSIMYMKKSFFIVLLIAVCVIAGGSWFYGQSVGLDSIISDIWIEEYSINDVSWMGVAEDGVSTCVVENRDINYLYMIPGESVLLNSGMGVCIPKTVDVEDSYLIDYSTYQINLYRIEDEVMIRSFELTHILDEYPEYLIGGLWGIYKNEGQYFVKIRLRRRPYQNETIREYVSSENESIMLYMDLESEEILGDAAFERQVEEEEMAWMESMLFTWDGWDDIIKENLTESGWNTTCFYGAYANPGCYYIRVNAENLPKENVELYSMFPELKSYQGRDGYYVHLIIGNYPKEEQILRLLMEDGQEISFEGVMLKRSESSDGEIHLIHSFEEYYLWKKTEEN